MKLGGRPVADDEIIIDVCKAVAAYERFQSRGKSNRESYMQTKGGPDSKFDDAIRSRLVMFEAEFPPAGKLLGSKQTFSSWKNDPPKKPIRKKRSVLTAVLSLTGIDISAKGILTSQPINLSAMSELAPLKSKKLTNEPPEEIDGATFEIELGELIFKSSEMTVMSDWIALPNGRVKKTPSYEIGTVVYGLKESDIEIDFGDTEPLDITRRISTDTDRFLGRLDGCVMVWSGVRQAWTVQPTGESPMRVHAERIKICTVRGHSGDSISLAVSAGEDQVHSDFRMRRQIDQKGKLAASQTGTLAGEQLNLARERLFSIVLAHRPEVAAILSFQIHKLP